MNPLERVASSRLMLDGHFPYPNAVDCMRYSLQEMCEYDDAMMRQEQPDHKRNNGREHDPRKELGQAGYMILSAYLHFGEPLKLQNVDTDYSPMALWAHCLQFVSGAVQWETQHKSNWAAIDLSYAWTYCQALMRAHHWDVAQLIEETCEDFERKHLTPYNPEGAQAL